MKKWITLVLLLGLLLCGCTSDNSPETTAPAGTEPVTTTEATVPAAPVDPSAQNVELTVLVTADFIWQNAETLDAMLADFNAYYPNILVTVVQGSVRDLSTLSVDLVLGSAEEISQLRQKGITVDMTPAWSNLQEDIYSAAEAACGDENGYHTVPLCMVVHCMAINRDMMENAQATSLLNAANHSWSAGNFLQACRNLYDAGMETAFALYCKDTGDDVNTRLLVTNLSGSGFVNTVNGHYTVNSNSMFSTLNTLKDTAGIRFQADMDGDQTREQFLNGNSAMVLNWNSALQVEHGMDNENIFYMLYPATGKTHTYGATYGLAVINQNDTTQTAASMTFAKYVSTSDAAARASGQIPARKSAEDAYNGTGDEKFMTDLMKLLTYTVEGEIPGKCWEQAREQWVVLLQALASDAEDLDIKECIDTCQEALDSILENANNG